MCFCKKRRDTDADPEGTRSLEVSTHKPRNMGLPERDKARTPPAPEALEGVWLCRHLGLEFQPPGL